MAYPPTAKWCFVRNRMVISWPQVYFRETRHPADCLLSREQTLELIAELTAGLDAAPDPDESGMVAPALAKHLPPCGPVPLDAVEVPFDPDAMWVLAEPPAEVLEATTNSEENQ